MASSYQYFPQQYGNQGYNPNMYYGGGQNYGGGQSPFMQYLNPLQSTFTGANYSLPSNYDIVPWPTAELTDDLAEFERNMRKTDNTFESFHKLSVGEQRNIRFAAFHNADARAVRIIQIVENSQGPNGGNLNSFNNWFTSPNDSWQGNAVSNWFGIPKTNSGWNNYLYNGAALGGPTPPYYYTLDQQFGGYPQEYGQGYNQGYNQGGYNQGYGNQNGYLPYGQMQGGYYPQSYNQQPVNGYWTNQYSF